jgi:hypothetical protein
LNCFVVQPGFSVVVGSAEEVEKAPDRVQTAIGAAVPSLHDAMAPR